ncbi:MAG: cell division protein FtsQ/DivIB, partial [Miltoncostaeaceae bacterium]
ADPPAPRGAPEHPAIRDRRRRVAREQGRRRRRRALMVLAAVASLALGWWLATGPLLSVGSVEVRNYSRPDAAGLRADLTRAVAGSSVVTPDRAALARAASAYPFVESIRVTRDLPRGLVVEVFPARPSAIAVADDGTAVLVSHRGRVLEPADPAAQATHGTLRAGPSAPAVGDTLADGLMPAVAFLDALEPGLTERVRDLTISGRVVTGRLDWGPELRLGRPERLRAKATALGLVLSAMSEQDRQEADYIDLTVPEHPAVGGLPEPDAESGETDGDTIPDDDATAAADTATEAAPAGEGDSE